MFFDEPKRAALTERYRNLPEREQKAYRALSVAYVPITAASVATILNACKINNDGLKWSAERDVKPLLERWEKAELVARFAFSRGDYWACTLLMIEVATREAIQRNEYDKMNAAAKTAGVGKTARSGCFDSVPLHMRALREALYRGGGREFFEIVGACANDDPRRYRGAFATDPVFHILANPLDFDLIRKLGPKIASLVLGCILYPAMDDPPWFRAFLEELDAFRREYPEEDYLRRLWAEYAMLEGRTDEIESAVGHLHVAEAFCFIAFCSLLRGKRDEALALYEEGLKQLRKFLGKRKVAFDSWTGIFYPLLLLAGDAPEKKIKDYADAGAQSSHPCLLPAYDMLYILATPQARADEFLKFERVFTERADLCLSAFFCILFAFWRDEKTARKLLPLAELTRERLATLGLRLPVRELTAVILALAPEDAKKYAHIPIPEHPLKNIMAHTSDWQRMLAALAEIGGGADKSAGAAKRFIWEIEWKTASDGDVRVVSIAPFEQSLQRKGWSKGRPVALKRIFRTPGSVVGMSAADRRVAEAIRETANYYGREYHIEIGPALEALAGHPLVFRESGGARVEIVSGEPRLRAETSNGGYVLKLSPFPSGGEELGGRYIVHEDGPAGLRVTRFDERHLKIARIVGAGGLSLPEASREALLSALGSLSSVVTVHADVEGADEIASEAPAIPADGRVYVQLAPSGEGLDVEMVARPLGPGSAPCRPGAGGVNIFGLKDDKRVQTRRDLRSEKDALTLAIGSCPALEEADETGRNKWHIDAPDVALEFLTQLQELGEKEEIVAEWPRGGAIRVRDKIGPSAMKVALRGTQEWFGLSGAVELDDGLVLSMKEMLERMKLGHGRFIPIGEGKFAALTEEFRRRLEAISGLVMPQASKGDESLRVSPLVVGLLSPLVADAGSVDEDEAWEQQRHRIKEAAAMTPELPATLRGELRDYQVEGYQWLARLAHWGAGACLADDMGLGKTVQALALLLSRASGGPALAVAPTSVCPNWIAEAARFAPTLNVKELRNGDRAETLASLGPRDVVVASYGLMQGEIGRLAGVHWHTIVLDEAQAIKNMGTRRSAAAMKLRGDFRMITTGTPIENRLSELWNLFRFLNPNLLGSHEVFADRYATPIERDGSREARARLRRLLGPFILRRNKEQVLDELPPKTEITLRVEMHAEEAAFYEALRSRAMEALEEDYEAGARDANERRFQIFAELMRLRRACCCSSLVAPEKKFSSAKLEAFGEILAELRENRHKALVFSQFVDYLTIVRRRLDEEGIPYQYLDGATPSQERARRVKAFQDGEGDCFLISLKAGGTGLNLTAADYVIHMDPWWNPAVEEQASDRAHRIGQERPVTVYRIVARGTIEEKIVDLHTWKRDLAEGLLAEADAPRRLDVEEMLALLREESM